MNRPWEKKVAQMVSRHITFEQAKKFDEGMGTATKVFGAVIWGGLALLIIVIWAVVRH